jgi:hypothetical protein
VAEEPRYTEAQWRTKMVHDECAKDGHRVANYVSHSYGAGPAIVGYCECCEVEWTPTYLARCPEIGRQGQQCLRAVGHDGEHTGALRVPADG